MNEPDFDPQALVWKNGQLYENFAKFLCNEPTSIEVLIRGDLAADIQKRWEAALFAETLGG